MAADSPGSFPEKITTAALASHELAEVAPVLPAKEDLIQNPDVAKESAPKVPFTSQVKRYTEARPWSSAYLRIPLPAQPSDKTAQEPALTDAAALRALLKDENPDHRGLAAEALATLDQPEDAPRLAELLDDTSESAPILAPDPMAGFSSLLTFYPGTDAPADSLDWSRRWQQRTVAAYARDGLKLITGREFADKTAFQQWWKHNAQARHCLWHWELRLQRSMANAAYIPLLNMDMAEHTKQVAAARHTLARQTLEELKQLPPEVEAKIRLLAIPDHAGGSPFATPEEQFWPEPPALRMKPERLLDLLERKNLWEDVDWTDANYNLLAQRLGLWSDALFKPQHVGRLRAVLKREQDHLWWSGKAAIIIGISRLHPAAKASDPDEAGTRDQILRDAAVNESDLFVRSYCAMELVRVGLPENATFLHRIAFEPTKDPGMPDVMQGILQTLARSPLDKPHRSLLADILLDDRFKDSWTRNNRIMGDDMNRSYAIWAVNVHAGRTLITEETKSALVDPARSAEALEKVRDDIKQLLEKP